MYSLYIFLDVLIVSPEDYKVQITSSLADYSSDVMKVELVSVTSDDFQGTADCLRFISKRIRGDFTFLSSDIICQFNIGDLINYHRINAADVTLGMIGCRIDEPEKKGGPKKIQVEEDEQEFSCLSSTGRLLMKVPISETEKALTLHKSLLYKSDGKLKLRTDIIDSGLYVFSRWIIDLLLENTALNSVRSELIPYLLQRQFQSSEYLHGEMPSIKHSKFRSAKGIDKWLSYKQSLPRQQQQLYLQESNDNTQSTEASYMKVSTKDSIKKSFRTKELCDYILEDLSASENSVSQMNSNLNLSESVPVTDHQYLGGMTSGGSPVLSKRKGSNLSTEDSSIIERTRLAATNTASGNTINNKVEEEDDDEDETDFESDFIRCFAYVCEHTQGNTGGILQRVSSANAYLALNR